MKRLDYLMDHMDHETVTNNSSVMIYMNIIDNRTGYYLELLTAETMKLLGSTKSKITKDVSHLEIAKVVLVHCNIVNNDYQQNSRVWDTFVRNNHLVNY